MLRRRISTCDLADNVTSLFCGLPACVNNWALLAFLLLLFFSFFLKLNVKLTCLCLSRWWHHIFTPFFLLFSFSHTLMELFFEATWGTLTRSGMERLWSFPSALARDILSWTDLDRDIGICYCARLFFAIVEFLRPVKTTVSSPLNKMQYRRCSCWSHLRLVFEVFGWTLAVDFARFVT